MRDKKHACRVLRGNLKKKGHAEDVGLSGNIILR
jgi:hypothetical protein